MSCKFAMLMQFMNFLKVKKVIKAIIKKIKKNSLIIMMKSKYLKNKRKKKFNYKNLNEKFF